MAIMNSTSYPTPVLAVDYGRQRIGLAISRGMLAEPLRIISATQAPVAEIAQICVDEGVGQLVVGVSENVMAEESREFGQQLAAETGLSMTFVDETLSSKTVAVRLKESGASLQRRQQPIDDLAAAVFLQDWLDAQE